MGRCSTTRGGRSISFCSSSYRLVFGWGGTLADFSKLVGGTDGRAQIEAATAGWAAAALAGLAGFFQVTGSRATDRRLAAASQRTASIVAGRLTAAGGLATLAAAGGLVALAARAGIIDPPRAVSGTVVVTVIYLSLGVLVGTLVRSEMNGASSHPRVGLRRLLRTRDGLRDLGDHPTVPPALPNLGTHRAG